MKTIVTVSLDIQVDANEEVTAQVVERLREWVKEYGYMATYYIVDNALANLGHLEFEAWDEQGHVKDGV